MIRFGRRVKLIPRYIGLFHILLTIRKVVYELALPIDLSSIHLVFYISMMWQYTPDESHELQWDSVRLDERLKFVEELVFILAKDDRRLLFRDIPIIKV